MHSMTADEGINSRIFVTSAKMFVIQKKMLGIAVKTSATVKKTALTGARMFVIAERMCVIGVKMSETAKKIV
jgi:hypothetical protein